jgi:hypothetical protein
MRTRRMRWALRSLRSPDRANDLLNDECIDHTADAQLSKHLNDRPRRALRKDLYGAKWP